MGWATVAYGAPAPSCWAFEGALSDCEDIRDDAWPLQAATHPRPSLQGAFVTILVMSTYCDFVQTRADDDVHRHYHDHEYGFPIQDDNALFERLMLEINQAGLSWELILKRKPGFEQAYDGFDIDRVAAYSEADRTRLLADAGIIRNRLKVNAAIENAKIIQDLQREHGSFKSWIDNHHPLTEAEWVKLFRKTFRFAGPEIVREFLMSTGYLPGAHTKDCPVFADIAKLKPAWMGLR